MHINMNIIYADPKTRMITTQQHLSKSTQKACTREETVRNMEMFFTVHF